MDNVGGYETANASNIYNALTTLTKTKYTSCEKEKPDAILEPLGKEDPADACKPSYDGYLLWFLDVFEVEYTYTIQCFKKKDLCYFVYENFLCPRKGVPTCQRLCTPLRASLAEAEEDFANLKLHDKYRSVKELEIVDKYEVDEKWVEKTFALLIFLKSILRWIMTNIFLFFHHLTLKLFRRHCKIKIWKDNTGGKNESKYE